MARAGGARRGAIELDEADDRQRRSRGEREGGVGALDVEVERGIDSEAADGDRRGRVDLEEGLGEHAADGDGADAIYPHRAVGLG
eukprot:4708237-Prymnesium_polylepis.1